jgi:peptidoglycan hydrolase-like protein with peptidoglycan-binding domain
MARIAKALDTLRTQVNLKYPNRDKSSDGWIGDAGHSARVSDHNPNAAGVVQALDLTHDPAHGFNSYTFADHLRDVKDNRIKYCISNHRIFLGHGSNAWTWQPYTGVNPHDHHVHVSVGDSASLYDDPAPWDIGTGVVVPPVPVLSNVLKRGDHGDKVRAVQVLLADGIFGPATEIAVKAFQREHGLVADGVVGQQTWHELANHARGNSKLNTNITATVFGGGSDPQTSAYDGHLIGNDEVGCSLPARVAPGTKVRVINRANGLTVTAPVLDVGPWNIDDPYWTTTARPQSETGTDKRGRITNHAGIDLTPAAAKAIGVPEKWKGPVDWKFA